MTERREQITQGDGRDPNRHWLAEFAKTAHIDPMVPNGYVEIRDANGKLLRRQYIGTTDG